MLNSHQVRMSGFVFRRETIRIVNDDPAGPPFLERELSVPHRVLLDMPASVLDPFLPRRKPRRGRPREPVYSTDKPTFERRVMTLIQLIEKDGTPATKPRVAKKLYISLSTFKRYCRRYQIDYYKDLVPRARAL
jgi:hypothetical protein